MHIKSAAFITVPLTIYSIFSSTKSTHPHINTTYSWYTIFDS